MHKNDRDFVGAIGKGLAVIESFDASSQRMTLSEVARKTGLTRPTARRYLLSLTRLRYAETDGKHFWLTHRVLRLGYAFLSSAPLPKIVQPVLDQIAEITREAASLSTIDGAEIVFLASSVAPRMMAATINVGLRLPAYCTAAGRVLLAGLPDPVVENQLGSGEGALAATATAIQDGIAPPLATQLQDYPLGYRPEKRTADDLVYAPRTIL
jgi:IclR family pca regulon transcriptional regulator